MGRTSHITIGDAARRLTLAPHLAIAGWRADARGSDGCHVTVGDYGTHAVLADGATGAEVLAQLRAPLALVPAVDAVASHMLASQRERAIADRFPWSTVQTRDDLGGAWAELLGAEDARVGRPVLAWAWGETAREARADLHTRLFVGDAASPCRLCGGASVVTLTSAALMHSGHAAQARVLSRGAAMCRVCLENSSEVADLDGGF